METLSSSVSSSSIKIQTLPIQPPHQFHHHFFKTLSKHSTTVPKKPHAFSYPKRKSFSLTNYNPPPTHTQLIKTPPLALFHKKAATGYATALIDIAMVNNSLGSVQKGVRKLDKWLKNEQIKGVGDEREKGEILKELVEKGKLNKHVGVLLRILVEKGKLGIVDEVLGEFQRLIDELCVWDSA